uniref:Tigger transposable element-derived protein 6 n=1 Tax=Zeugodacus cucurbitae TaxID=28588 RepID=A0A0A1X5G3_ZEUCU
MTGSLWSMIMKEFDREMGKQKRKVFLVVDNAACHKVNGLSLDNVKIEFLPPNTTSVLQPLDQGVIHCFKIYCRQILIRKQILSIGKGDSIDHGGLLKAKLLKIVSERQDFNLLKINLIVLRRLSIQ